MAQLNKAILNLQLELKRFEPQFHKSSEEFYDEFSQGNMDDREEYVLWAGLYEMLAENQRRLDSLQ